MQSQCPYQYRGRQLLPSGKYLELYNDCETLSTFAVDEMNGEKVGEAWLRFRRDWDAKQSQRETAAR